MSVGRSKSVSILDIRDGKIKKIDTKAWKTLTGNDLRTNLLIDAIGHHVEKSNNKIEKKENYKKGN